MDNNIIVHVSEVDISLETGMGRVEFYWKLAFEKQGFTFIHIGPKEVGHIRHKALFPYMAYRFYKKLNIIPKAFIIHEPASGCFVNKGIPCFVESHGVETRYWNASLKGVNPLLKKEKVSLKTKLFFPLWRLQGCIKGLKNADKLLLINTDDKEFVKQNYHRKDDDIMIFRNGVNPCNNLIITNHKKFVILFNGQWLARKGIYTLVKAAELLQNDNFIISYLLIGTGKSKDSILNDWPESLWSSVEVHASFEAKNELTYLQDTSLYILPSFFEGQPLSLLQAMAAGKCCITTNCCGQKDIVSNGKTGFLFTPGDTDSLVALIKKCYHNKKLTEEIGNNAKNYVAAFNWDLVSKTVVDYVTANI